MKRLAKLLLGICMALIVSLAATPVVTYASSINLTLGTTDNARVGDTVTARIVLGNNPGLSTMTAVSLPRNHYMS